MTRLPMARALMVVFYSAAILGLAVTLPWRVATGSDLVPLSQKERELLRRLQTVAARVGESEAALERLKREGGQLAYEISEATRRAAAFRARLESRRVLLKQRLRALYRLTRGGYLRLLTDTRGRGDLLVRLAAANRMLRRDTSELQLYADELRQQEQERLALERQAGRQRDVADGLRTQRAELQGARGAQLAALAHLRQSRDLSQRIERALAAQQEALVRGLTSRGGAVAASEGLAAHRGNLPRPVHATGAENFGQAADRETRLDVARSGLTFPSAPGAPVVAVARGIVRAVQAIDGYGLVVIIEHAGSYYTLYGFLQRSEARIGQSLAQGVRIGMAGRDPLTGRAALYFELRHHDEVIDPRSWFRK